MAATSKTKGALLSNVTDFDLPQLVDKGAQLKEFAAHIDQARDTREL
jgi:hypothetical protein